MIISYTIIMKSFFEKSCEFRVFFDFESYFFQKKYQPLQNFIRRRLIKSVVL